MRWLPARRQVSAKCDDVLMLGGGPAAIRLPCRIDSIDPLDVKALRSAEKALGEARRAG